MFCERGIRTYETYTRNTLDISAIPALKNSLIYLLLLTQVMPQANRGW